jgi:hypothetical protein
MFKLELEWKSFNLNLASIESWMKANAGPSYCGNQAHSKLELWFTEEPSQEAKDAILAHWEGLTEESPEASGYVSKEAIASDMAAKKASGRTKLLALGLTDAEVSALVG